MTSMLDTNLYVIARHLDGGQSAKRALEALGCGVEKQ
jgi:hypothetical protein